MQKIDILNHAYSLWFDNYKFNGNQNKDFEKNMKLLSTMDSI